MGQELVIGSESARQEGLRERVAAYERRLILEALVHARGNQRRAAAALGCLPTTLNEKMRRLGLRGMSPLDWSEPSARVLPLDPTNAWPREL